MGSASIGPARQAVRLLADQDLVRLRRLLETGGDVDGVARRQPLLGAGDDLTGVDARAQSQRDPVIALQVAVQDVQRVAELAGCADGARASSSCTVGMPNTAMMASPMTSPQCRHGARGTRSQS